MPALTVSAAAMRLHALAVVATVGLAGWSMRGVDPAQNRLWAASAAGAYLLVAVSAVARVAGRSRRPDEVILAVTLATYSLGWVAWAFSDGAAWASTLAIVAWVTIFPGFLLSLLVLMAEAGIRPSRFALDALAGSAGSAAAVLGFLAPALGSGASEALPGGLPALYLAGNVAMTVLNAAVLATVGARLSPALWIRLAGVVVLGLGSGAALIGSTGSVPAGHDWAPVAVWLVGTLLVSLSVGWRRTSVPPTARGSAVLAMPLIGIVVALAVLVAREGLVAEVFAAVAILLAAVRLGTAFLDVNSLAASRELALTDELTGLPNRRAFLASAEEQLRTGEPVILVMVDLNGFKEVNDAFGHATGDQLLVHVGRRLASSVRSAPGRTLDLVARLGGDEFAVLLPADGGLARVERMTTALALGFEVDAMPVVVSAAAGVAPSSGPGDDLGELLRRADVAMYAAKTTRTAVVEYRPELDTRSREWFARVDRFRTAVADGGLELVYQPKVDLRTGRVSGVEALARLRVAGELLVPAEFLEPLTRAGGLCPLSHQVIDLALNQARQWLDRGLRIPVSVNISAESIADGHLRGVLQSALARHGLPGELLVIELTERDLLADHTCGAQTFTELRAAGVRVSVDDYGTGWSSLAYLRDLPIDEVKLDRTFVATMVGDDRATRVVESVVTLAHALGQRVVAEGVEDETSLVAVRAAGCDEVQGYLVARPMPAADLESWLTRTGHTALPVPTGPFRS